MSAITPKPILLILGAGPNIGTYVSETFASRGYKIAVASRSSPESKGGHDLHIAVDLSNPENVYGVFEAVKANFGALPSVVIYNCKC
jgi:NAD(P)-dependent dehydrogenase (short-subunit alcohol dehydrogenase family)